MKTQVFKEPVPIELLQNLFNNVTQITDNKYNFYYEINKVIFKKLEYNNLLKDFLNSIKDFYYESKKFYITRDIDYTKFLTIIRQICKINNIKYDKKIVYLKNYYDIIYYIYMS